MGDTVYGNQHKGDIVLGNKNVPKQKPPQKPPKKAVLLLLSANARDQQRLRIDEERRAIDEVVSLSSARDRLDLRTADAVRLGDLHQTLLRHRPVIVHFSGHADKADGLSVQDERGASKRVPPAALTDLFRILGGGVRCVVLNACHTDEQAEAIAAHVPCVVGMRRDVLDHTAIQFSTGFYRGIANEQSVQTSYDLALNGLDLHRLPGSDIPKLIARRGAAERAIV